MPNKLGVYLWKLFVVMLFIAFSALTLFFAYGYQFDFKKRDFTKTSIIDVTAKEKSASVMLDGTQQSEVLPFQIKGVLPGRHLLSVNRPDFQSWKREVEVEGDIVTIVDDVLLVPENVDKAIRPLKKTAEKPGRSYFAGDYIVEIREGEKKLSLTSLFEDGTIKDEEIELFKAGMERLEPLENENFLIYFSDGGISWVNFRDKKFVLFVPPAGAEGVKVSPLREMVYFTKGKVLYGVPFSQTDALKDGPEKFRIIANVEAYVPVFGDDIYYISGGMLFKSDFRGREKKLIDYAPDFYKNIDFYQGKDYGSLILRDRDDERYLVLCDRRGRFTYRAGDLSGQPRFNGYDQLIFAKNDGEVVFYDPQTGKSTAVAGLEGKFEVLGWFSDRGHYLIREGTSIRLRDVFNANTYTLVDGIEGISNYFTLNGALFFIKEDTLNVLNWSDDK